MSASHEAGSDRPGSCDMSRHQPTRTPSNEPESEWVDEDDDDMEYEPTTEGDEEMEFFETEDDDGEYHDAEEGLRGVEIEFSMDEGEGAAGEEGEAEGEGDQTETEDGPAEPTTAAAQTVRVPRSQLMRLLGQAGLGRIFVQHMGGRGIVIDDEDDEDDVTGGRGVGGLRTARRTRPKTPKSKRWPKIPSETGKELMDSGSFGTNDPRDGSLKSKKNIAARLLRRELGLESNGRQKVTNKLISQNMIPSSNADTIIHYDSRCYSGQFSDDGNFFFSCAQDFRVRMYDTSNPYRWKYYKTVDYPYGQWTITDASLSPDNRHLAYSSIRSQVCLAPTDPEDKGEPFRLEFSNPRLEDNGGGFHGGHHGFGIWAIRFSGDGREIVAGTSNHAVYVYDIETRQSILKIAGHDDHVNAVCYGDTSSPHILYSGSDDTTLKVWDRRSMGDSREAGVFLGHTEGLTYVDSKGDGRYVLSNAKDQTMKLWDLRKMMTTDQFDKINPASHTNGFDYRFAEFDEDEYVPHPHDCSLVTFRGHSVLKTLIRCHFSPPGSTDSRYVYSGSEDGSVYVYNLDATLAGRVDVNQATKHSRPRDDDLYTNTYEYATGRSRGSWKTCVRDASWHPNAPVIAATSWNGWGMSTGTCTLHTWNDGAEDDEAEPKMGQRVDGRLRYDEDLYDTPTPPGRGQYARSRLRSRRAVAAEDDDDDDGGL